MDARNRRLGMAFAVAAGISFGALPLFATWLGRAGAGVWLQVVVRIAVSLPIFFALLVLLVPRQSRSLSRRQRTFTAFNGFLLVLAFTTYVFSIALGTPPAKAILLMYLYPIYVVLLGPSLLGERITGRRVAGIVLGVLGAVVMLKVWTLGGIGQVRVGDFFALANGVVYAVVMILGRKGSAQERMQPLALTAWTFAFGLLWLLVAGGIVMIMGGGASAFMQIPTRISVRTVLDFLGIATLGTAVPYGLIYASLKHVDAATASVLSLVEPLSVIVLAMVFLHQPLDIWHIVGGVVILAAGVLVAK